MEITQSTSATTTTPVVNAEAIVDKALSDPSKEAQGQAPDTAKKEEQSYSSKLQQLARQERKMKEAIEKERLALKTEREEWEKQKSAPAKTAEKKTPVQVLLDAGYTYAQATEYVMEHGVPTAEDKVKEVESKLEKFMREAQEEKDRQAKDLEAKSLSEKEQLEKAEQEAVTKFKESLGEFITANAEKYELTALYGEIDAVYEVMDGHFAKTGKMLSNDEAAELVEKHLEELAEKATKTKKFQTKFGIKEIQVKDDKNAFSQRTLSNVTTNTPTTTKVPMKTDEERRARAMAILDGAN